MKEFVSFWKNGFNFTDRTTRRGYWMAFLFLVILSLVIGFISGVAEVAGILPFFTLFETMIAPGDYIATTVNILDIIWFLAIIIPSISLSVRRLRDIGKKWTWIFISFIPVIGTIIYIVLVCKGSIEDDGTPVV